MGGDLSTPYTEDQLHEVCESMYVKDMPKKEIIALTEGHIAEIVAQEHGIDPSLYRHQIVQLYGSLSESEPTSFVGFVGYTKCVMQVLRVARASARRKRDKLGSTQQVKPLDETNLKQWNLITENTVPSCAQGEPNSKVQHLLMDKTVPIRDVPDDYVSPQQKYCHSSSSSNQKKVEKLVETGFDPKFQAVLLMAGSSDLVDYPAESIADRIQNLHIACHNSGKPTILFQLPESLTSTTDVTIGSKRLQVNQMLYEWAKYRSQVLAVVDTGKLMPYDGGEFWEPDGHLMTPLGTKVFYERLRIYLGKVLQRPEVAASPVAIGNASSSTSVPHALPVCENNCGVLPEMTHAPFTHTYHHSNASPSRAPSILPQSLLTVPTTLGVPSLGFKPLQTMSHVPSLGRAPRLGSFAAQPSPATATPVFPFFQTVPPRGTMAPPLEQDNGTRAIDAQSPGDPASLIPAAASPSMARNDDDIDRTRLPANFAGGLKTSATTRASYEPMLIQPMGDLDVSMDPLSNLAQNADVFTTPIEANVISTHPTSWDPQKT